MFMIVALSFGTVQVTASIYCLSNFLCTRLIRSGPYTISFKAEKPIHVGCTHFIGKTRAKYKTKAYNINVTTTKVKYEKI